MPKESRNSKVIPVISRRGINRKFRGFLVISRREKTRDSRGFLVFSRRGEYEESKLFPIFSRSGVYGKDLEIPVNFKAFLRASLDKKRRPCIAAKPSIFLGFSRFSLRGIGCGNLPRRGCGRLPRYNAIIPIPPLPGAWR